MPKDVYLQPEMPDPVLTDAVVLRLVQRHVPGACSVTGVDESGGEARSYLVDDAVVLKTQRPHRLRPRTSLAKEAAFLRHLEAFPAIPVPRVLGYGQADAIEYLCMTRMPGDAVIRRPIAGSGRTGVLQALGRVLREIHTVPQEPLLASGLFPGDRTVEDLQARLAEAFDEILARLEGAGAGWMLDRAPRAVADTVLATLPASTTFVALHSNPGPEHTFADPDTHRYTGTIDFGDAYIGHPALDLRRWKDPADREALLEGYLAAGPVDDSFVAVWRVTQVWADMVAIATTPAHRDAASAHLQGLLDAR
jgi:aminoglycoside phosphotransferase (APT) family kinase protein